MSVESFPVKILGLVASSPQSPQPSSNTLDVEFFNHIHISRYSIVVSVSGDYRPQPFACFLYAIMHSLFQFGLNFFAFPDESFPDRFPAYHGRNGDAH